MEFERFLKQFTKELVGYDELIDLDVVVICWWTLGH